MLGAYSYSQETKCNAGWRKAWEERSTTCPTQGLKEQADEGQGARGARPMREEMQELPGEPGQAG